MIREAIGVVFHVAAIEEECAVAAGGHEGVPFRARSNCTLPLSSFEYRVAEACAAASIAVVEQIARAVEIEKRLQNIVFEDEAVLAEFYVAPDECAAADVGGRSVAESFGGLIEGSAKSIAFAVGEGVEEVMFGEGE